MTEEQLASFKNLIQDFSTKKSEWKQNPSVLEPNLKSLCALFLGLRPKLTPGQKFEQADKIKFRENIYKMVAEN